MGKKGDRSDLHCRPITFCSTAQDRLGEARPKLVDGKKSSAGSRREVSEAINEGFLSCAFLNLCPNSGQS